MVPDEADYQREAPSVDGLGQVHMLVFGLDYAGTGIDLRGTQDAENVAELAQLCGVSNIRQYHERECTRQTLEAAIAAFGTEMSENDFFIFYFSGHGTQKQDARFPQADQYKEGYVLWSENGETEDYDDGFAEIVGQSMPKGSRVLVISDCCHSGNIADLENESWDSIEACAISGCLHYEESEEVPYGGLFTHSLFFAIERLQRKLKGEDYSVGKLFNSMLKEGKEVFDVRQTFVLECSSALGDPSKMAWPLMPEDKYTPPKWRSKIAIENHKPTKLLHTSVVANAIGVSKVPTLVRSPGPPSVSGYIIQKKNVRGTRRPQLIPSARLATERFQQTF